MRKTLPICLLLLSLLLSACAVALAPPEPTEHTEAIPSTAPPASTAPTAPTEPTDPAAPSDTEPLADSFEDLGQEVTETPEDLLGSPAFWEEPDPPAEAPWEEGNAAMAGRDLPPGGFQVHTDYSAYSPYQTPEPRYTRLRPDWTDHFIPSADYGAVYPFAGARFFSSEPDGYSWEGGALYGFIDRQGRILTDPVFDGASALGGYDPSDDSWRAKPWWLVRQMGERIPNIWVDGEGNEQIWYSATARYGLISMDGSRALPCVYSGITGLEQGFVAYTGAPKTGFEVYGENGELRFTQAALGLELPEKAAWGSVSYGEGLYLVRIRRNPGLEEYWEEDCEYWFCDPAGKPVLGPYAGAETFSEGLACVALEPGTYGYIDKSGAWVIEPQFYGSVSFRRGVVLQQDREDRQVALNRNGEVLLRCASGQWLEYAPCGFRLNRGEAANFALDYYDQSGKKLISGNDTLFCLDRDTFCWTDWNTGKTHVKRISTGEEIKLSQQEYMTSGDITWKGERVPGYIGYRNGLRTQVPRDLSGSSQVKEGEGSSPRDRPDDICLDEQEGVYWYLARTETGWEGLCDDGRSLSIPFPAESLRPCGDLVRVITRNACLYTDLEGRVIFCCPLDAED